MGFVGSKARKGQVPDLVASYWTLAGGAYPHTDHEFSKFDFRARVEAAARVGFRGFGIWHADLVHSLERYSLAQMKRILDDNGMRHVELEFLTDWFLDGERRIKSDVTRRMLMEAAEVFEAHHIKVGDFYNEPCPMTRLIDSFAALCAEAGRRGTSILFELMPFATIHTLDETLTLLNGVGADNGGVILDLWHVVKLGIPYEQVRRIPLSFLQGVEINDGYLRNLPDFVDETTNHRKLCGEGEFDIRGFIDVMLDHGYTGPWGIEVLNAEIREWPLQKLVHRAWESTINQFRE
jgi:sugar phosphate isomerase/epimerase